MSCISIEQPITQYPEFARYRRELGQWIAREPSQAGDAGGDLDDLESAGAALCQLARTIAVRPEQILVALHPTGPTLRLPTGSDRHARDRQARAHRQALAVNMLLRSYFS